MKFTISSTELLSYLQQLAKVLNPKTKVPILDNFLFEITGTTLQITSSDIENTMVAAIELENVEGEGRVTIPSKILIDALKEFPDQPLTFSINLEAGVVNLKSANGDFNMAAQPADEYPKLKEISENSKTYSLQESTLVKGLSKALFATSDDSLRPVLCGVLMEMYQDKLVFVASNGQKLVKYETIENFDSEMESVVFPKKIANILKATLGYGEGELNFSYDERSMLVESGNIKIYGQLVEGTYPNYNTVIFNDNPYKLHINRDELIKVLKRVGLFANQSRLLVKLSISKTETAVSTQDLDFNNTAEEVIKSSYDGEDLEIGFHSLNLVELLSNLHTPEVEFQIADHTRAVNILPTDPDENENVLMLLIPLALDF